MRNAGSIGGGIFLLVIGAILTFALQVEWSAVDKNLIGYLLMAAGGVLFLIGLISAIVPKKTRTEVHKDPTTGSEVRESDV